MTPELNLISEAWAWLNRPEGIAPWAEHNQGLISVLALGVALVLALYEQHRANLAEARIAEAADEAKSQAAKEAHEALIFQRLSIVSEFAVAARGVLLKVENELQEDRDASRPFIIDTIDFFAPEAWVRQGARASAETLNALLSATPLSPGLVNATRQGAMALHAVAGDPVRVNPQDFEEIFSGWIEDLAAAREAITNAQMEFEHRLLPGSLGDGGLTAFMAAHRAHAGGTD